MEVRCYRKILHISYKDHVTNEEVHDKIQQAFGPKGRPLTTDFRYAKVQARHTVITRSGPSNCNVPQGIRLATWSVSFRNCKFSFEHDTCRHARGHYSKVGDVAQLAEHRTGTLPMQVRFPSAAGDFSPRVNFLCRLSYSVCTPQCAIACMN